jgi:hypothetical protein
VLAEIANRHSGDDVAIEDEPLDSRPVDRHRMDLHNCHSPSTGPRPSPDHHDHGSCQNEGVQGEHRGGTPLPREVFPLDCPAPRIRRGQLTRLARGERVR